MITIGVVLIVIGWLLHLPISFTIGVILALLGLTFWILGLTGHPVAHRKYWY